VPIVQHLLGLATAGLMWITLRRLGASAWVALVPAAAVALGGAQLWLEHAVMSESVFTFCLAFALVATVEAGRATQAHAAIGWSALAALLLAAAATLRLPALFVMPLFAIWILAARGRPHRTQLAATGVFAVVAVGGVLGYLAWYESGTGHFAFTRTGFYNSYARVATFADCSKFTPPAGTAKLCPRVPIDERLGHEWWIFAEQSPLWQHYGPSFAGEPPPTAADEVSRFVRASILHQPDAYLAQVGRDLWRVVNPGAASTVGRGSQDAGYGQREMIESFTNEQWASNAAMTAATNAYYHPSQLAITDKGGLGFFRTWERVFRFTGPLMLLTLLLACAAPFVAAPALRRPALLLAATGLTLLLVPILTSMYDARYVVPALAPLTAAAALAGSGLSRRAGRGLPNRERATGA
jgi:hypothetical protein